MSRISEDREGFETLLEMCAEDYRMAIIRVCDTCEMAQRWFVARGLQHTAADILELAKMINAEIGDKEA